MTERIDLDRQSGAEALALLQLDDAVEDRFPVSIAGEVVVGDEVPVPEALGGIGAEQALDVVSVAVSANVVLVR